jgi:hypothetical protein
MQTTSSCCKESVGFNYCIILVILRIMYKRRFRRGRLFHSNVLVPIVSMYIKEMCSAQRIKYVVFLFYFCFIK